MIRIAMLAAASIAGLIVLAPASVAQDRSVNGEFLLTQACGWYAIVGCSRTWEAANSGAAPGTYVIDTNQYPNFRNGWFCAVDGPYATEGDVPLWQWKRYRSDAYVKSAC